MCSSRWMCLLLNVHDSFYGTDALPNNRGYEVSLPTDSNNYTDWFCGPSVTKGKCLVVALYGDNKIVP